MKRALALLVMVTVVAAIAPIGAHAAAGPQEVEGTVLFPAPGPNGETTGGCWTGVHRRIYIFSGGAMAESPFGSIFEVDKATWSGKFKLDVTSGGTGAEDLDIYYYNDFGKVDPVNDPAQQAVGASSTYVTRKAGGEVGTVPAGSTGALVCLAIGSGYNAAYKYVATPPKKKG
ncbi:MAG TPA: hypothetical protein VG408_06610 [Actinomycetota bacterium]|nr:hypothetical protein [Actinomycetota bacterium]